MEYGFLIVSVAATMKSCLGATKADKFQRRNLLEKIRIGIESLNNFCYYNLEMGTI